VAQRYHELAAWQLANELKQKVYALVETSAARDDRRFADQIRDAAASGPRNLAEGFAYYRHREFAKYTPHRKGIARRTAQSPSGRDRSTLLVSGRSAAASTDREPRNRRMRPPRTIPRDI
jgi:hypothetical protein